MKEETNRERGLLDFKKTLELLEARIRMELASYNRSNEYIKQHLEKLWQIYHDLETRMHDTEVQVNLLTRLLTTLSLEHLQIDLRHFRRLIRRMEKELEIDSEIAHLEDLFQLEPKLPRHHPLRKTVPKKRPKGKNDKHSS